MNPQRPAQQSTQTKPSAATASSNGTAGKEPHPLASVAGSFADDPMWDEFILAMEEARRELDAADAAHE